MEVVEVDPDHDALLRDWHAALRDGQSAGREAPLVSAYDEIAASLRVPSPRKQRTAYAARERGAVVGALLLERPLLDNLHLAELELAVPPAQRGRGVGAALYEHGAALAGAAGRTTFLAELPAPTGAVLDEVPGPRFAHARGFASVHVEDHLVLDLPVAEDRVLRLRRDAEPAHSGYDFLAWSGACPQQHLATYADLRSAMERDAPLGDVDYEPAVWTPEMVRTSERRAEAQGYTSLVCAALDRVGAVAGYTLMHLLAHQPGEVLQDDTLVLRAHRGHRLGTALKARNLLAMAEVAPDARRVHTWNAVVNAPMQDINRAFGFRVVEQLHEFQKQTSDPGE